MSIHTLTRSLILQSVFLSLFILPSSAQQQPKLPESSFFLFKQDNGAYSARKQDGSTAFSDLSFGSVFNAVVSSLPQGGDIRLAGNTTFTVDKSLNIPNKWINVQGGGNSTILKAAAGLNASVIYASGDWSKGYISLQDFQIDGNKANNTSTDEHGIELYRIWNANLRNLFIHDVHGDGIYTHAELGTKGIVEARWTDLTIYDAYRCAIHLGPNATDFEIENVIMRTRHGLTAPTTYAVYCEGGGGAGTQFSNIHSYEFDYGFWIDWGDVAISNFHSDGNKVGIMLNGSRVVQVTNSWFSQNPSGAIIMKNAMQNIMTANTLIFKGDTSNADGINISGKSTQNIITGSFISGYKGYGINLTNPGVQNTVLSGNIVSGNGEGWLNDHGSQTTQQGNVTH